MKKSKNQMLLKKAMAVILGVTMTCAALMLPDNAVKNELTAASAYTYEADGCSFTYELETDRNVTTVTIKDAPNHGETVKIPATITHEGNEYPVTKIYNNFLYGDQTVKTVIFPENVKKINLSVLNGCSVESIELPDSLEWVGAYFAANCPNLTSVKYTGTKITRGNIEWDVFKNCEGLRNEKGAICLGNWLLDYDPDENTTTVKLADLGNDGVKIENMCNKAVGLTPYLTTLDLEGIKFIGFGNFEHSSRLSTVLNDYEVEEVSANIFMSSPWRKKCMEDNLFKVGRSIIYYKTDSNVLDLTSGELKGTKSICNKALVDCKELDTIFCDSDCTFGSNCFYVANDITSISLHRTDPLPVNSVYKIKNVYLDGKKLTYKRLLEDDDAYTWLKTNIREIENSELTKTMVEEKTKELFEQLDIPYYGMGNDKVGTLTPTEEFYTRLKIFSYMSIYDYDHTNSYHGFVGAFLLGGKLTCTSYAEITHYLLECAGVEAKTCYSEPGDPEVHAVHFWNATRIGDEWFFSDDGWSAQNNSHSYSWLLRSSTAFATSWAHEFQISYDSFHYYPESESSVPIPASRYYGDMDGDDKREKNDAEMLWDYVKGTSSEIDRKAADMNFDGKIDVTDAVLLDRMIKDTAVDKNNVPIDGLAPTVQVAILNGTDYENIKYVWTDRGGYITLPDLDLEAPEGKKLSYDVGMVGQRVRITTPLTVINVKWIDADTPDYSTPDSSSSEPDSKTDPSEEPDTSSSRPDKKEGKLGDVNNDGTIDIEDAVAIIQHINGVTPLKADEEKRADVSKDNSIDIDDAVTLISYINGNSTF